MLCVTRMNSIVEGPDHNAISGPHGLEPGAFDAVLDQFGLDERQCQRRAVNRSVDERHDMWDPADVIFVPVREHERGDAPLLLKVREVGNDPIHAEQIGIREHDPGVDHNRGLAPTEGQHVHAELAESAKGHDFEHR